MDINVQHDPDYTRRVWHHGRADQDKMRSSLNTFDWENEFDLNYFDAGFQASFLNKVAFNIASNFIPNEEVIVKARDPPWLTKQLKKELNRLERFHKKVRRHGYKAEDTCILKQMKENLRDHISRSRASLQAKMGEKLANEFSNTTKYWSLLKMFMNTGTAPVVPTLIENDVFVVDAADKAEVFNKYFAEQCTPISTASILPDMNLRTDAVLCNLNFLHEDIVTIIRSLNPNKAHGWDEVTVRIVKHFDASLARPFHILFRNCLQTGVYPSIWKHANVVPIHKQDVKNLIKQL